jgi:uncharacterized protein YlbG (UPF0298 family)
LVYNESINKILDQLSELKYVITVLGTSKSDILRSFSQGNSLIDKIIDCYNLKDKYSHGR